MRRLVGWGAVALVAGALLLRPGPVGASVGSWVTPLEGPLVVRRGFDPPAEQWQPGHRGADLAGRPGAVVRSAGAGTVTFAGVLAGRGVVTVTHGRLRTTYEPLTAMVPTGTDVGAGDQLGRLAVGHGQPRAGEALLHWGLRRGATYLDPLSLIRAGPPRLLPHWRIGRAVSWRAAEGRADPGGAPRAGHSPGSAPQITARSGPGTSPATPLAGGVVVAGTSAVLAARRRRRRRA